MRDISEAFLDEALSDNRIIGARATIRDTRLIFDPVADVSTVVNGGAWSGDISGDRNFTFQSCVFDGKILRVGCFTHSDNVSYLVYHYADPASADWENSWQLVGSVTTMEDSQIGIWVDEGDPFYTDCVYVFYHSGDDKHIHRIKFNGTTWSDDEIQLYMDGYKGSRLAIMPIDRLNYFLNIKRHGEPPDNTSNDNGVIYSQILFITGASLYISGYFGGTMSIASLFLEPDNNGNIPVQYNFQIIEHDGIHYLFAPEAASMRYIYFPIHFDYVPDHSSLNGCTLGAPSHLLPIDVVDDDIYYKFGGASVINNKLWVSGVLSRSYGKSMHIYSIGPDNWSMARDIYIHGSNIQDRMFSCPAGRLFEINNKIYYVGSLEVYEADSTFLSGYDNPAKKVVLESEIISAGLDFASNDSYSLDLKINGHLSDQIIRRNSTVTLELKCNDIYEEVGIFSINGIAKDHPGNSLSINCSSNAVKKIKQWVSDASYDYWSQTKSIVDLNASGQTIKVFPGMVRGTGEWTGNSDKVWPITFGQDCILFSTEKASRSSIAKARFEIPTYEMEGLYSKVGVVLNYYRETRSQAAIRLGKSESEVLDSEFGNSYLAVYLDTAENKFYVSQVINSVTMKTWDAESEIEPGEPIVYPVAGEKFWISASFIEGAIEVFYRKDEDDEWVRFFYSNSNMDYVAMPWSRSDMVGRAGILLATHSEISSHMPITKDDKYIAVDQNLYFSEGDTILVEKELMTLGGKSVLANTIEDIETTSHQVPESGSVIEWPMYSSVPDDEEYIRLFENVYSTTVGGHKNVLGNTTPEYAYRKVTIARTVPYHGIAHSIKIDARVNGKSLFGLIDNTNSMYDVDSSEYYEWFPMFLDKVEYGPINPETSEIDSDSILYKSWGPLRYYSDYNYIVVDENNSYFSFGIDTSNYLSVPLEKNVYGRKMGVSLSFWMPTVDNTSRWPSAMFSSYFKAMFKDPSDANFSLWPVNIYLEKPLYPEANTPDVLPEDMSFPIRILYSVATPETEWFIPLAIDLDEDEAQNVMVYRESDLARSLMIRKADPLSFPPILDTYYFYQVGTSNFPSIIYSPDATYKIHPTYFVSERGVSDTPITAHLEGTLGGYAANPGGSSDFRPTCDKFEYYSAEMDMRLEDVIAEISGKAGVNLISQKAITTTGAEYPSAISYSSNTGEEDIGPMVDKNNFIVKFIMPRVAEGGRIGIKFRRSDLLKYISVYLEHTYIGELSIQGYIFAISGINTSIYYPLEKFPVYRDLFEKEITISVIDNVVSLWIDKRFAFSYRIDTEYFDIDGYAQFFIKDIDPLSAFSDNDIQVDWSELCERVDNFILDMGYNGQSLISDVISERRVFYQDDQDGNLRIFRNRDVVNDGDPYVGTVNAWNISGDITSSTHILLDGISIVEDYDEALMKSDGRIFYYGNSGRLDTEDDMRIEISKRLMDEKGMRNPYTISGQIDPRVEPNDILECLVDSSGTEKKIVVQSVRWEISSSPMFKMEVSGYEYIS